MSDIKLCEVDDCTGCFACLGVCKHHAIQIYKNNEGFFYPVVDVQKCIECHACERICPVLNPIDKNNEGIVYAAWAKNDYIREHSSSGGIFSVLALKILEEGGVVVGAKLFDNNYVNHIIIDNVEDLDSLRGSKYVQSFLAKELYLDIKSYLAKKKKVLFCGTPCQVAGIRNYIKNNDFLFTIDLVCHGVPSPMLFAELLAKLKQEKKNFVSYQFRDYKNWLVCTNANINVLMNGKIRNEYLYGDFTFFQDAFLKGYMHRENCYRCQFASKRRMGDITLADFWGIGSKKPITQSVKTGCSLVSINTVKGEFLFEKIQKYIFHEERDIQETIDGGNEQLVQSSFRPLERDSFYKDSFSISYRELIDKYQLELKTPPRFLSVLKKNILKQINLCLKRKYR